MGKQGWKLGVLMVGIGLGGAIAAPAQNVKVNWRVQAPFHDFRTYQILPGNPNGPDAFWTQFLPKYLNSALQSRGMNPAAAGAPADLKVSYHFRTQDVVDSQTTADGFGWGGGPFGGWGGYGGFGGWGGYGGPEEATTRQVPRTIGVLTVDLVEAHTNQVVWRGQATEDSIANSQHGDEDQVWKSVGKMFEHYPPKPDKDDKADKADKPK